MTCLQLTEQAVAVFARQPRKERYTDPQISQSNDVLLSKQTRKAIPLKLPVLDFPGIIIPLYNSPIDGLKHQLADLASFSRHSFVVLWRNLNDPDMSFIGRLFIFNFRLFGMTFDIIKLSPWVLSERYLPFHIPTRGDHTLHAIIFFPPDQDLSPESDASSQLAPLHIDFHGGAFLGGIAQ